VSSGLGHLQQPRGYADEAGKQYTGAGRSNIQIAERLFLGPDTVRVHLANIFARIGVHNRAAATAFARQHGLA